MLTGDDSPLVELLETEVLDRFCSCQQLCRDNSVETFFGDDFNLGV